MELPLRAVIYARYSSDLQSAASIEDQVRVCKERIAREGWDLIQVFADRAVSGATTLRPGYQALLAGVREGAFEVALAEALDRLSRDQEDVAALFKRLQFAGIRLITLSEGEISELHVGLKGTMNALFLRDLAAKSHRGMRGRVEAGKAGGGLTYGYDVVRSFNADGSPVKGERTINAAEAATIRRIFELYATGVSPKKIALMLNGERISAPRGGAWTASTINGNRARGTGILNNELYVGRLVWNCLAYVKDPETGRRRSRHRADAELVTTEVPELRIISQELWERAKERQRKLDAAVTANPTAGPGAGTRSFWKQQRPQFLFSGLIRCGACGSGFSKISAHHFGCAGARLKGPTVCTARRTIRRDVLEAIVLGALRGRMMDPEIYRTFAAEFTAEWNRLQAELAATQTVNQTELAKVRRQIDRLVDAITNGSPFAPLQERLTSLECRKGMLEAEIASATAPAPLLHPNLPDVYRDKMAGLAAALAQDDAGEARETIRSLVDAIVLTEADDGYRIDVRGELAHMLGLAACGVRQAEDLHQQIKLVAGAGFDRELTAFV